MYHPWFPWVAFNLLVVILLALDLFVFNRKAHAISFREAIGWSIFWIGLAMVFNMLLIPWRGYDDALKFSAGYLLEKSLSVDNLFVFLLLFTYFQVPAKFQHRVLFWGIIGAIVMRIIFILAGVALINHLHWVLFVFGGFLILTGIKMAFKNEEGMHPEQNPVVRLMRRIMPISPPTDDGKFFTLHNGKRMATPLFVVLIAIETTDVIFAIDSVPAVIGVIRDPVTGHSDAFLAYSSNIFAILGLRALYFALAGLLEKFHYLHFGLAAILIFVGIKMLLEAADHYQWFPWHLHVPTAVSLSIIGLILTIAIAGSLLFPLKSKD
ncbi:MAG: TerC family protein [Phycisphaerales bacterium]|nr:TerC family protein [Phycisphaerales bacterium]